MKSFARKTICFLFLTAFSSLCSKNVFGYCENLADYQKELLEELKINPHESSFFTTPLAFSSQPSFFHEDWLAYMKSTVNSVLISDIPFELEPVLHSKFEDSDRHPFPSSFTLKTDKLLYEQIELNLLSICAYPVYLINDYPFSRVLSSPKILILRQKGKSLYTMTCLSATGGISVSKNKDYILYSTYGYSLNKLRKLLAHETPRMEGSYDAPPIDRINVPELDEALGQLEKSIFILEKTNSVACKEITVDIPEEFAWELLELKKIISHAAEKTKAPLSKKNATTLAHENYIMYGYTGKDCSLITLKPDLYPPKSFCQYLNQYTELAFKYMDAEDKEKSVIRTDMKKLFSLLVNTKGEDKTNTQGSPRP